MLVKVGVKRFINPAHIVTLHNEDPNGDWTIRTSLNTEFDISPAAAAYLMDIIETSDAITLPGEPDYIDPATIEQPLTSRLAQLLRHEFMQGASVDALMEHFNTGHDEIHDALATLMKERVVIFGPDENARYWHVSHYPKTQNLTNPNPFGLSGWGSNEPET